MFRAHDTQIPIARFPNSGVVTGFLDRLANQLKTGRDAAYRRALQRTLEIVRKNYLSGAYQSTTEAEQALRKLVEQG